MYLLYDFLKAHYFHFIVILRLMNLTGNNSGEKISFWPYCNL